MISYHDLINAFHAVGLRRDTPVLAHFGDGAFGKVKGGVSTWMGALLSTVDNLMLPAFTFSTMVIPQSGPADNDLVYGEQDENNLDAHIFSHQLPSECGNQAAIDLLTGYPGVYRSSHPIFSFYGLGLDIALLDHEPKKPYKPIAELKRMGGWVLLADAAPSQNFSIHFAEMLAGRKQFTRWALTAGGVAACPFFPGCPDGFQKLNYYLQNERVELQLEDLAISGVPLNSLIDTAVALLREDPFALLCNDLQCQRCNLIREDARAQINHAKKPESGED